MIGRSPISKAFIIGSQRTVRRPPKAVVDRVFTSTELLASFPYMGRAGRDEGTREWVVPRLPYIVVYEVHEDTGEVIVIAVFHGAQDWEARLKERRDPAG